MPRLIIETDGVFDLENQLLNGGSGGTGDCCVLGDDDLQSGLLSVPEPSDVDILEAEQNINNALGNTEKRMYTAMQDPKFAAEDMMIFAKIAKDNRLHVLSAPGISVALLNKLSSMLASPENTPRELLFLEQAKILLKQASEPTFCEGEMNSDMTVQDYTFGDFGAVYMEEIQG